MVRRALLADLIAVLLAVPMCAQASFAQGPLPAFEAEALSGRKVTMPGEIRGHTALLVVCFTHASGPHCAESMKRLQSELPATGEKYTVVFLEDAPRLVRSMAKSGIKSTVAKQDYDHYLIVTEHEKEVKAAVHFRDPDEAYVILLAPDGKIQGTWHGSISPEILRQMHDPLPEKR